MKLLTLMLAALSAAALQDPVPFVPFVIDHHARQDSAADVSFLLDAPAGKHSFVTSTAGHLAFSNGLRFRIWGVNLTGWTKGGTLLPPKNEAPVWAAELARMGVNCVRFHFLDRTTRQTPAGLIDAVRDHSRAFDPDQLDRLDFFIFELKRRGIYSDLNLNVGRTYKPGDLVPDSQLIGVAKAFTYIGDRLLELQREYARMLLTHFNPYTKSEYRNEPAIAIVEIVNENSVLEFWSRNWLRGKLVPGAPRYQLDLTPHYEQILNARFNKWLAARLTPLQLAQLRKEARVAPSQPMPRLRRDQFSSASKLRFRTEAAFYSDIEIGFFRDFKAYLKNELGVKSLIVGTADHTYFIPGQPLLRTTSQMDIADAHVYWQHHAIWGRRNTPMVNEPLESTVVKLTRSAPLGRPFMVSEVNHPLPNEYASEMIPILASYGAFQDWDGIFFYTFEPKVAGQFQSMIPDPFDIAQDPVRVPQMAAGALLFLRRDVKPAQQIVERTYSSEQVDETMRLPEHERPFFTPGFPLSLPLRHGSRVRCIDCVPTPAFKDDPRGPFLSDTRELAWHEPGPGKGGLVTIDTDRTQALVGFVKDNARSLRHLLAEVENDFCAITLSSLDSKPIATASRLLVTAGSRAQNTGTEWNARRTLWEKWGGPPSLIQPVTGWIMLRDIDGAVGMTVTPLDGAARPIGKPLEARRLEKGWEFPTGAPATTWYLVEVVR